MKSFPDSRSIPMQTIPAQRSAQVYLDASEQESGLFGWHQRYAQAERGPYRGSIERLELDGLMISRERVELAVEQSIAPPEGRVIFCQALMPTEAWRFNAHVCTAGLTGFIRGGEEHLALLPAGAEVLIVEADAGLVARDLDESPARMLVEGAFMALPEAAEIRALAEWFVLLLGAPGMLTALVPDLMLYNLGRLWGRARHEVEVLGAGTRGDYRIFRRAEDLMMAGGLETPSVSALATELGLPVSALRRAFLHTVGIGPVEWLHQQRLDGARRDLRQPGTMLSVTDVAMKWGFVHLGRFSAVYAAQFGETPSTTLRRARDGVAGEA